jgi:hypothetical protein
MQYRGRRLMTIDASLELISTSLQAILIGVLLFRRIYRKFPLFSTYLSWVLVIDGIAFFVTQYHASFYDRIYSTASIVDAVLMFCVLVELAMSVLRPIRASLKHWAVAPVAGFLALVFAAIWPFAKPPGFAHLSPLIQHIIRLDITSSALRIVFFLALAGFSQLLAIGWRDRELQIATGLGFYSLVSLSVTLMHMNQGTGDQAARLHYHLLDQFATLSYICSMLYWIASFAQKEPERRQFTPQMENFLLALAGNARSTRMAMSNSSEFKRGKSPD